MCQQILTDSIKDFIREHAEADPSEIALKASRLPDIPANWVAQQIKGRQKAKSKLPSWFKNEDILFPPSISMEQCTSEVIAAFKCNLFQGQTVADLTGGFGIDCFHLAQSFDRVVYIERDKELSKTAARNFATLGVEHKIEIISGSSIEWLRTIQEPLDLIYVDPARRNSKGDKVSELESCEPNVLEHWDLLQSKAKQIAIKASPGLDIQLAIAQLKNVSKAYVLSHKNECKELLFICSSEAEKSPIIHCVDLLDDKSEYYSKFDFTFEKEHGLQVQPAEVLQFLYEPNAAIMKGGGFKSVARKYGLYPLHPRTRLYTSDDQLKDFPGRVFEIEGQFPINRKELKEVFPNNKANIISRNCGLTPSELKKKLKLTDGGPAYAIATTLSNNKRAILKCSRLK
ncbi:class I SAM-dependent methyltransferase [Puniceicoccaceae bacterium K14]|nr:class I SAM-dependent methyltransferase [Puniceicoccaceae bacterium K14]